MMGAAACGAGDFDTGLFDMFRCATDLLDQVRRGVQAMSGGQWHGGPWERKAGGPWERKAGGPWERKAGGPWERKVGGRKGPGHWGGGFGGPFGSWWPGPPGPQAASRSTKAGRCDVRAAVFALLREGPRNGYQIMSEIEERSGGAWRPSPGAVYPALSQLADEGLIEGEESGGRRTFRLTEAGREYVERNPEMARAAWESAAQQEDWQVPGLFAEAARLGGGIVQIAHAGTPEQVRAAERLLEQTRRDLYRILADESDHSEQDTEI
jgi:DNA-binding PadR family transcriptional regulator